jgi:hypothetical protein
VIVPLPLHPFEPSTELNYRTEPANQQRLLACYAHFAMLVCSRCGTSVKGVSFLRSIPFSVAQGSPELLHRWATRLPTQAVRIPRLSSERVGEPAAITSTAKHKSPRALLRLAFRSRVPLPGRHIFPQDFRGVFMLPLHARQRQKAVTSTMTYLTMSRVRLTV